MKNKTNLIYNKPIIGIIGGCGPDATIDIQIKLSKVMKLKLNPQKDQDYFGVLVNNDTQLLDRTEAIASNNFNLAQSYINRSVQLQKMGASVLLIACNTAHAYYDYIQSAVSIKLLNMIKEVAVYISTTHPSVTKVGLICTQGTLETRCYHNILQQHNIQVVECDPNYQAKVHHAIYGIKAGFITRSNISNEISRQRLYDVYKNTNIGKEYLELLSPEEIIIQALDHIKSSGINHTILGCTELPLAINQSTYDKQILIDPNYVIANSAVLYCFSMPVTN